jgi:hypothetical protein
MVNVPNVNRRRWRASGRPLRWLTGATILGAAMVVSAVILKAQSGGNGAAAAIPYHGYLELAGVPVDGLRHVTFTLYDGSGNATGWSESQTASISGGHFAVLLGAQTPLDDALRTASPPLSVGVAIQDVGDGGAPIGQPVALTGRQLLGSVPYARRGAPGKDFLVDGAVSAAAATVRGAVTTAALSAATVTVDRASVTTTLTVGPRSIPALPAWRRLAGTSLRAVWLGSCANTCPQTATCDPASIGREVIIGNRSNAVMRPFQGAYLTAMSPTTLEFTGGCACGGDTADLGDYEVYRCDYE